MNQEGTYRIFSKKLLMWTIVFCLFIGTRSEYWIVQAWPWLLGAAFIGYIALLIQFERSSNRSLYTNYMYGLINLSFVYVLFYPASWVWRLELWIVLLLVVMIWHTFSERLTEKAQSEPSPLATLSKERKQELEQLRRFLKDGKTIITLDGDWGTGKSLLVEHVIKEERTNYHFIEIDVLTMNLEEPSTTVMEHIERVLWDQRVYPRKSIRLKRLFDRSGLGKWTSGLHHIIFEGAERATYSEQVKSVQEEVAHLEKPLVLIFEDVDRIDDRQTVQNIFGISEKLAHRNIRIIYQLSMNRLRHDGHFAFDYNYLEKYVPIDGRIPLEPISFINLVKKFSAEQWSELMIPPSASIMAFIHNMEDETARKDRPFLSLTELFSPIQRTSEETEPLSLRRMSSYVNPRSNPRNVQFFLQCIKQDVERLQDKKPKLTESTLFFYSIYAFNLIKVFFPEHYARFDDVMERYEQMDLKRAFPLSSEDVEQQELYEWFFMICSYQAIRCDHDVGGDCEGRKESNRQIQMIFKALYYQQAHVEKTPLQIKIARVIDVLQNSRSSEEKKNTCSRMLGDVTLVSKAFVAMKVEACYWNQLFDCYVALNKNQPMDILPFLKYDHFKTWGALETFLERLINCNWESVAKEVSDFRNMTARMNELDNKLKGLESDFLAMTYSASPQYGIELPDELSPSDRKSFEKEYEYEIHAINRELGDINDYFIYLCWLKPVDYVFHFIKCMLKLLIHTSENSLLRQTVHSFDAESVSLLKDIIAIKEDATFCLTADDHNKLSGIISFLKKIES